MMAHLGTRGKRYLVRLGVAATVMATLAVASIATAEYGDVVLNNHCDESGVAPVVFPHWFHRIRFRCKVCHGDLGIALKAGADNMTMVSIIDGQYCGACHNGDIAWGTERCDLCHSGKHGLSTQVQKGTAIKLGVGSPAPSHK